MCVVRCPSFPKTNVMCVWWFCAQAASLTTSLSNGMAAAQGVSNTSGDIVYYDSVKAFSAQQVLLGAAIANVSVIASLYRNNWGAGLRTRSSLSGIQNLTLFAANSWG